MYFLLKMTGRVGQAYLHELPTRCHFFLSLLFLNSSQKLPLCCVFVLENESFSENSSFFLSTQCSQNPQVANMEVNIKVVTVCDLLPWYRLIYAYAYCRRVRRSTQCGSVLFKEGGSEEEKRMD